jgi:hypothetical protein
VDAARLACRRSTPGSGDEPPVRDVVPPYDRPLRLRRPGARRTTQACRFTSGGGETAFPRPRPSSAGSSAAPRVSVPPRSPDSRLTTPSLLAELASQPFASARFLHRAGEVPREEAKK